MAAAYVSLAAGYLDLNRPAEAEGVLRSAAARGLDAGDFAMLQEDIALLRDGPAGLEPAAARVRTGSANGSWISRRAAAVLGYSGRLEQSRSMWQLAVSQALQEGQPERAALWEAGAALQEAFAGNAARAMQRAAAALDRSDGRAVEYGAGLALALAGDSARAQRLANDLERRFPEDTAVRFSYLPALRARLALNSGNAPKALELLQAAIPNEMGLPPASIHGLFGALYPVYVRGEAYLKAQRGAEAAAEFEKIVRHRELMLADPMGALAHLQLARALTLAGETTQAAIAYHDFFRLWKDGDRESLVLRQARSEYARLHPVRFR